MDGWFTVLTVLLRGDFVGGEGGRSGEGGEIVLGKGKGKRG